MRKIIRFSDVTARDGLQSLSKIISPEDRTFLIKSLSRLNFSEIEVGSLVNPKVIPTMANSLEVYHSTYNPSKFKSYLLVGNETGIDVINKNKIKYFSLFSSPSDTFNIKNINANVEESFKRFKSMLNGLDNRDDHHIKGYISCIGECPFEGDVPVENIIKTISYYKELGVNKIWEFFFRTERQCFKKPKYTFHHMIETDGVSCSILMLRNDLIGKRIPIY
jgi:hydroxymethylglutaryl-CoA lyase